MEDCTLQLQWVISKFSFCLRNFQDWDFIVLYRNWGKFLSSLSLVKAQKEWEDWVFGAQ